MFGSKLKSRLILLFSLFLVLFMGPTTPFDTIYKSHCPISANFYLYLLYFQQKVFNFSKIIRFQIDHKYPRKLETHKKSRIKWVTLISDPKCDI